MSGLANVAATANSPGMLVTGPLQANRQRTENGMAKPLRVAGEVDSWCTKCRLSLNHRIVSMKNGKAYQVECLTCRSTHLWRPNAPGEKAAPAAGGTRSARPSAAPKSSRVTAAMRQEQAWEQAIAGRGMRDFKPYAVTGSFREGDFLRHKKFGDGVVVRVIEMHKIEVLFKDEPRTLAQGMT